MLDVKTLKKDFPIFQKRPELVYLDSTATALKPKSVIQKTEEYYAEYSANVHRGIYEIAEKASEEYEETRGIVARFIKANSEKEIIFTKGTTESLNLIMYSWGEMNIHEGDEIVTSILEHHANFVPWQQLALRKKAVFKVATVIPNSFRDPSEMLKQVQHDKSLYELITPKTKLLALTYISNVTGTINPIQTIIKKARQINPKIIIVIDGAQAVPHLEIDVKDLDADFFAFSSHKMLGPTGVGVLWGRESILEQMRPFQYGGDMILNVQKNQTTFNQLPYKFEAGTPDIAGIIAFKEAIRYLEKVGMKQIHEHEQELITYALSQLQDALGKEIKILGSTDSKNRAAIISFSFGTFHPHDIAQILSEQHIGVRAGHHCAMPLHTFYNQGASTRASFYLYNGKEDVDKLIEGLLEVKSIMNKD